jgi:SRSO17 transposase
MPQDCERIDAPQLDRLWTFIRPLLVELEGAKERVLGREYIEGLVGPSERKTVEPMVRARLGVDRAPARERRAQEMLVEGTWNHRSLMLLGAERLLREGAEFSAYTLDDSAILKQGKHSVGVARQYAGCLGGLANCQAVVTVGFASEYVSTLIAAQLFLPASWCTVEAAGRREACRVPPALRHRTKPEIGLGIVREVAAWGLPKLPWLCDSAYGDNTDFRNALARDGETYVAGASLGLTVWPLGTTFSMQKRAPRAGRPPTRLVADGKRRPVTIAALAASLPCEAWQNVLWRYGSRGPQRGRFAAVRVRPARGITKGNSQGTIRPEDLQEEQWLLLHWPEDKPMTTKAWLSNLGSDTDIVTLVSLARLRWRIERDHEESKGLLGFDHYEGRTWPGLHHHLAFVIVAEQFLALERFREARETPLPPQAAPAAISPVSRPPDPTPKDTEPRQAAPVAVSPTSKPPDHMRKNAVPPQAVSTAFSP